MKKTIAYSLLIIALLVFLISSVDGLTKLVSDWRKTPAISNTWLGSDQGRFGDLYTFTYLSDFKTEQPVANENITTPACPNNEAKQINLYALSDSYTWEVFKNPGNFCGVAESKFAASNFHDVLPVKLDKSKKNIIIIETVERNVRTLLSDSAYIKSFVHVVTPGDDTTKLQTMRNRKQFHFNFKLKDAEANYEFMVWNYRFLMPLKELKADINYKWFNRVNPDATVSPDKKLLLLTSTIDTTRIESAFRTVPQQEVDDIVQGLNNAFDHYKKLGFDEVYLAVIPNPVTVLFPHLNGLTYNNLIPRLQSHPRLKLRIFDSYTLFKRSGLRHQLYRRSDTHWTSIGRQLFLDSLNAQLKRLR